MYTERKQAILQNLMVRLSKIVLITLLFQVTAGQLFAQGNANSAETNSNTSNHIALMDALQAQNEQTDLLALQSPAGGSWLFETNATGGEWENSNRIHSNSAQWARMAAIVNGTIDVCDQRIPVDSVQSANGSIRITQPGSYYLTKNVSITSANSDGIVIISDNVTLDLNGYTLDGDAGGITTDDGIFVQGDLDNIFIKNGIVKNWDGDGVNALNCDNCSFTDLIVENNGGDGLVTDFGGIIFNCTARGNGRDGLEGDDNTIIYNSTASNNLDNGIEGSEGVLVFNCTSVNNESDGIDVQSGSRVEGCTASGNDTYGIDVGQSVQVLHCVANNNGRNGIDAFNSCLVKFNTANNNGSCFTSGNCDPSLLQNGAVGAGIRAFANVQVINNICRGNYYGVRMSSADAFVSDNVVTDNAHAGLTLSNTGSFAIRNRANNNGFDPIPTANTVPGNYSFNISSSFGPIVDLSGVTGDISSVTNSDHPFANFIY